MFDGDELVDFILEVNTIFCQNLINTEKDMNIQQQIYHEIETLPPDAQIKILKMVHFLKTEILTPVKRKPSKKQVATLADLDSLAIDTGISDLAAQHDHYLYGMPKK